MVGRTALNKVLYVEDDADIRSIAELALRDVGGLDVSLCESGPEALSRIDDFSPDLVLLDVMMPGMDGPQTLQALQQRPQGLDVPVVFMTARLQPSEIEEYLALGAIGVIPKPFDPMTLADDIRALLTTTDAG
ncbi:response regulator [Marinobacter sp. VGCF2001]|uniref:response regulator n=1 Tax=Marinobacter sp. VGCF2001 TaxID=3417189 RepID=UPI003CEFEA9C